MKVSRVVVVSVVLGGLIGLEVVTRRSDRVASVALNDIAPERPAKPSGTALPQTAEELPFDEVVAHLPEAYEASSPRRS